MSNPRYSEQLALEILNYKCNERTNVDCTLDCAFCGHRCHQSPRKPARTCPQTLFDKYPTTIKYIFKKLNLQCKKSCNKCFNLLTKCILAIPEEIFQNLTVEAYRKQESPNQEVTNKKLTNEELETFKILDQLKEFLPELFSVKRKLDVSGEPGSPSKGAREAKKSYTLLVDDCSIRIQSEPKIFENLDAGPGRPGISPALVDLVSDLMVEGRVSATKCGKVRALVDLHLKGRKHSEEDEWCAKTSLRALVIKYFASDLVLCKWMAEQKSLFAGFDGCSAEHRRFMEFHLIGVNKKKEVSKVCLKIVEIFEHTTGVEMANVFCNIIKDLIRVSIKNNVKLTTLLDITGLTYDTTSENTGCVNGINTILDSKRKELWDMVQSRLPPVSRRPYPPLQKLACCDHVSSLILVHFLKEVVSSLESMGRTDLVCAKRCIIVPMFECFGNLLAGEDGDKIITDIKSDIDKGTFKTRLQASFQNIDDTRYLSLPVLIEKFLVFQPYIKKNVDLLFDSGKLTEVQKKYISLWKTSPLLHGIAKFLVMAKNEFMQPTMRIGNSTHSMKEWTEYLQTTLNKASSMKHERCHTYTNEIVNLFPELSPEEKTSLGSILRCMNKHLAQCVHFILLKWYGDIITEGAKGDSWIVATNRESERIISIVKDKFVTCKHMKEVVINAYCRLRFLPFHFVHAIPKEQYLDYIRAGRDAYNEATTRKEINKVKKLAFDKEMAIVLEKYKKREAEASVFKFLVECGAELTAKQYTTEGKADRLDVTVAELQNFLGKLSRRGLYVGETTPRLKKDYIVIVQSFLMPLGASHFRSAYLPTV
jgi:hypothetical protein